MIMVDYSSAIECVNPNAIYGICHECGGCGRIFDAWGFMVDDGGTHEEEDEYDE